MSDEKVTKTLKPLGRPRTYSDADARRAFRLYHGDPPLTGAELEAVFKRPRTTCLEMVKYYESDLKAADEASAAEGKVLLPEQAEEAA